jgi:hypothetical protein
LKGNYTKHINKKFPCSIDKNISQISQTDKNISQISQSIQKNDQLIALKSETECQHCSKQFSSIYCKRKHIDKNRCSSLIKKNEVLELKEKIIKLEKESQEKTQIFEAQVNELKELFKLNIKAGVSNLNSHNNNNNNNSFTNNTQNITNNIVVNAYGKEDLSHITADDYKNIFKRCLRCVPAFILKKHYDVNKPENANIYLDDIKGNYCVQYVGGQWNVGEKMEILQDMYDDNCDALICQFEIMKNDLDKMTITKFTRFIDMKDDPETVTNAKEDIKQYLYNERCKAYKNKKLLKN